MTALEYSGIGRHWRLGVVLGGMPARARAFLRRWREEHEARAAARQLASMSDWQLKDIGMHRSQIWYLVRGTSAMSIRSSHAED
jgi:uncharacterized protein YjiS (DUF1127 family)